MTRTDHNRTPLTTEYANVSLALMPELSDGLYEGVSRMPELYGVLRLETRLQDRFIIEITGGFCE